VPLRVPSLSTLIGVCLLAGCGDPDDGPRERWVGAQECACSSQELQLVVSFEPDHHIGLTYSTWLGGSIDESGTWSAQGDTIHFAYDFGGPEPGTATYVGVLDSAGSNMSGTWGVSGFLPFHLAKVESGPTILRE